MVSQMNKKDIPRPPPPSGKKVLAKSFADLDHPPTRLRLHVCARLGQINYGQRTKKRPLTCSRVLFVALNTLS